MRSLKVTDLMSWLTWLRLSYALIIAYMNDRWNILKREPLFNINIKLTQVDSRNHLRDFTLERWTWASYNIRNLRINNAREACLKPNVRKEWRKTYIYIMENLDIEWRNAWTNNSFMPLKRLLRGERHPHDLPLI
jgi:hypothetical protein